MKNKINIIVSYCAALLLVNAAQAQELQIEAGGRFIQQTSNNGFPLATNSEGYSFGLGYSYYLNSNFSIGLGFSFLKADLNYIGNSLKGSYAEEDIEGDTFEFRYKGDYYSETVKQEVLQIPLTIQYETKGIVSWYLRTGVIYGIQTGKSKYKLNWRDLKTSGYYPQWDAELNGPDFIGFGEQESLNRKGTVKLQDSFSWMIETGVKQQLASNNYMYFGVFFELGLNDIRPEGNTDNEMITFTNNINEPLQYHSVLEQKSYQDKKLTTYMIGLKIKYGFNFK